MLPEEIIHFAKLIVENVRDQAIKSCDVQLHTDNLNSPIAKRWRDVINNGNIENLGEMIISDCVDDTIFYLLKAIDEGILNLSFNASSGKQINLSLDGLGELSGWYMGEWRSKYSNERCSNDLE
jgi:hypothetical protein